jgi:cbb3-type cytochrome oxidase maturation protein
VSVIYLILPLALLIIGLAVGAFVWAARKGQFDDLTTPGMRVLHDDEKREEKNRDS